MKRQDSLTLLGCVARRQGGYFTRTQALRNHIDNTQLIRFVRDGTLEKRSPGVYFFSGAPLVREPSMWEYWMTIDPTGSGSFAYCCLSTVSYYRLGSAMSSRLAITKLNGEPLRNMPRCFKLHQHNYKAADVDVIDGLRVVKPYLALMACIDKAMDADKLQEAIDDGLWQRIITNAEADQLLKRYELAA